ncbi:MAG: Bug family tripartite tricarboxylate transporter substrate binding protein [Alphaproteobacteria bacterium]
MLDIAARIPSRAAAAIALGSLAAATFAVAPAQAQQGVADFYKGKNITVLIGYAAGGTYDATARLLSRHMPKHIPGNPQMVPTNLVGAGSIKAILNLYSVAPKDGTHLGMVARSYAIEPVFNPDAAKYDPAKFNPIGSSSSEVSIAAAWHTAPFKTFDDLFQREITVGSTGMTDDTGRFPLLTRNLTGAKIKIVQGYPGGNDVTLAMEREEVQGRFGWSWGSVKSRARDWLDQKKITVLFQMALNKAPDMPDVPWIMDYVKNERDKQALELLFSPQVTAWPLIAPPDVPADRIKALRASFDATMKDPAFLAEADKLKLEVEPISGEEMHKLVQRLGTFDKSVVERAVALTSTTAP